MSADAPPARSPACRGMRVLAAGRQPSVTFEIGDPPRTASVPASGATQLPDRADARQRRAVAVVTRRRPGAAELGDRVRRDAGPSERILLPTNTGVSWSYPTGKALIAPAVADNHLLWRTAGQPETRTDISFLERTDVAGTTLRAANIFAAGQAADGTARAVHRRQSRREPAADRPTRPAVDRHHRDRPRPVRSRVLLHPRSPQRHVPRPRARPSGADPDRRDTR